MITIGVFLSVAWRQFRPFMKMNRERCATRLFTGNEEALMTSCSTEEAAGPLTVNEEASCVLNMEHVLLP